MDGKPRVLATSGLPVLVLIAVLYAAPIAPRQQPSVQHTHYVSAGMRQACDVHEPLTDERPPLVVVVHGGGGVIGDKGNLSPEHLARRLARDGFVVLNINYRLAPQHPWPAAVNDVHAAIEYARHRADALAFDPDLVFVIGLSAGALFAEAAVVEQPDLVQGVVAVGGVHDLSRLRYWWVEALMGDASPREAAPIQRVRGNFPPTLLIHGDRDRLVPLSQSLDMQRALSAVGCEASLVRLSGASHFFPEDWFLSRYYPYVVRWLRYQSQGLAPDRQPLSIAWLSPAAWAPAN